MRISTSTTWTNLDGFTTRVQGCRTLHPMRALERPEGLIFNFKKLELLLYFMSTAIVYIHFLFSTLAILVNWGVFYDLRFASSKDCYSFQENE